jgi:hypothetical protein
VAASRPGSQQRVGQRPHPLALVRQPLGGNGADHAVQAGVGSFSKPGIELGLEVGLVGEPAAGLEARLHVLLQALDRTLGLGVARPADQKTQPTGSWPQKAA